MSPLAVVFLTHAFSRARLARPALPTGVRRASALALISSETHSHGLCIIDAHNLAYRMYHALPLLVSKRKEPAHALLGLCNKLWMLRDVFPGYRMLCVFDEGAPTSRIELLPQYKQNRERMPDALRLQMGHIREAAECFGVPTISVYGTEADDLIATAVARATTEGVRNVCVVSSDKDLLQLVTPAGGGPWSGESTGATNARTNVTVFDDRKKLLLDAAAVRHKFHGVEPAQVVDYLALVGDASDNVPGIPGIGPKTAAALLIQFGSLEGVLAAAPAIKKSKRRDALIEFGDVARLGKQLIVLDSALETVSPASLRGLPQLHPADLPHLRPFLQEHGFLQLERRLYIAREEIAARQLKRAIS